MQKNKLTIVVLIVLFVGIATYFTTQYINTLGTDDSMQPEFSVEDSIQTNMDMFDSQMTGSFNIVAESVSYFNETQGYFARPTDEGVYPGVIMIHEWWGLNENIKNMAEKLASEGYNVLAVDLYNGSVAEDSTAARTLVGGLDQDNALQNMKAAASFLRENESDRIASLGWCFGGGQSMQLALSDEDLAATVIYYGNLETDPEKLDQITWPVLGVFGDQDQSIPVETVDNFESALDEAGVENDIYMYEGVGHAFANPSGDNYAPEATMDAWEKTRVFLENNLK